MAETPRKTKATSTSRAAKKATTPKTTGTADILTMPSPAPVPTHDEIADLARKYWAERGYADGHQEEDWLRAEHELRAKAS
jgi:Protein of unknown function (DUF2934)